MKFQVNQTYSSRSIGDSDCIFKFQVMKRTEKSVWLKDLCGMKQGVFRRSVVVRDGIETVLPYGNYSMSPILKASNKSTPHIFYAGDKVTYSGFPGTVVRHVGSDSYEVRLSSGLTCVCGSDLFLV